MDQSAPASPGMSLLPLQNPTNPKFPALLPQLGCRTFVERRETSFIRRVLSLSPPQGCSTSPWLGTKVSMPQTTGKTAGVGFLCQPGPPPTFPNRSSESHTCHGKGSKAEATAEKESGQGATKKAVPEVVWVILNQPRRQGGQSQEFWCARAWETGISGIEWE